MVVNRWPQVAQLYDAELDKLAETPERFVELGLRLAQIYEVQLEDVDNADRPLPPRARGRAREPERGSLARSPVPPDRALGGARGDPRARGRDRADARRDPRVQVPPRSGPPDAASNNVDAAIAAYRDVLSAAPEHETRCEALEGALRQRASSSSRSPRSSSRSTGRGRVGEARRRPRGAARAHAAEPETNNEERLAAYYRIAELLEEQADRSGARARRVRPRAQGVPARREDAARRSSASPASIDGGWETLANAYADVLGLHTGQDRPVHDRQAPRASRSRTSSATSTRRRRRTATSSRVEELDAEALANLDRIYLSLESVAGARRHPRAARACAGRRPRADRALRPPRRGLRGAPRRHPERDRAPSGASSTSSTRRTTARSRRSRASTRARRTGPSSTASTSASSRTPSGDVAGGRDPREARAPRRRSPATIRAGAIDTLEASSSISAARIRGARGARRTSTSSSSSGRELVRRARAPLRHRRERRRPREHPHAARARSSTSSSTRDDLALETGNRVLDIDFANLAALRAIAAIRRRQDDPQELVTALHQHGRSRRGAARRRGAQGDLPRARQDLRRAARAAVRRRRRLAEAARGRPATSRRWTRSRAIYRAEEQLDRRHRRQDAARRCARGSDGEKIEEYRRGRRALARDRSASTTRRRSPARRSSRSTPTHDEAFRELEKLHTRGRALGAADRALPGRLDTREETSETDRSPPPHRAVFEEKLDDKNQAFDALVNAFGEDFHDRRDGASTSSAWRRRPAAGAS